MELKLFKVVMLRLIKDVNTYMQTRMQALQSAMTVKRIFIYMKKLAISEL